MINETYTRTCILICAYVCFCALCEYVRLYVSVRYVNMCVCMFLCVISTCAYVCFCALYEYVRMYVSVRYVNICVFMFLCVMWICAYVCFCALYGYMRMYVSVRYVNMCVCMFLCVMWICACVRTCMSYVCAWVRCECMLWLFLIRVSAKLKVNENICWSCFLLFFSIDFFYIYIYCRKFNAAFNKLIKTVVHCARVFFFKKWCWTHPPLPPILSLFGYFHILTYQVLYL